MFPELFLDEKEFLRGGMRIFPLQLDFLNGTFSLFIWACTTYKTKQKSSKPPTHRGFFLHPHMHFGSIILEFIVLAVRKYTSENHVQIL
jgi:hypothetical protein